MKKKLFVVFLLVGLSASVGQAAGVGEGATESFLAKVGRFFGLKAPGPFDAGKQIGVGNTANSTSVPSIPPCTCDGGTQGVIIGGVCQCCPPAEPRGPQVY